MALANIGDYLTAAQSSTLFEAAGAALAAQAAAVAIAAAALSDHVNAVDPHPQYLTAAEGAAAFDASGAAAAAQAASQPAAANLTSWAALAPAAKQDAHANLTTLAGLASLTPLTRLAASGETVTTSSPLLDLAQTWNGSGVAFTGLRFNVTDTASASASLLLDLQVGGSSRFVVRKDGKLTLSGSLAINAGTLALGSSGDLLLERDAANIFAQRNGTNAQAFRVYNTYTDASNYERGLFSFTHTANTLMIGTEALGTGAQRGVSLRGSLISFEIGSSQRWAINGSGHLLAGADNTYDIGASGATRPRKIYVATDVDAGGYVSCGNTSGLRSGRMRISTPTADGVVLLQNSGQTDFSRLQFGGTTSSFPALKRNANSIDVRLADDSGYAPLQAAYLYWTDNIGGCYLRAEAANIPAFRNGTNAQLARIYNTYTDVSNYERLEIGANAGNMGVNTLGVMSLKAGTGTNRELHIGTSGAVNLNLVTNGTNRWRVDGSGHLVAATDNTYDIGALGATRPRTGYFSSKVSCAYVADTGGTNRFDFSTANMVGLFGSSNAYPGLKRNSARLDIRLGDDTGYAALACGQPLVCGGNAIAAGGAVASAVLMSTTAAFGIYFGSGAPTVTAAKGSLYLRSDGSGTGDRMYVNTDGGTTWTAITTAA